MATGLTADQLESGVVTVRSVTIPLTDAQIKALPTTPVEIVPAPGAGYVNVPLGGFIQFIYAGANKYTNVDSDQPIVVAHDGSTDLVYITPQLLDSVTDGLKYAMFAPMASIDSALATSYGSPISQGNVNQVIDNKPIVLTSYSTGGVFTGGNAANEGSVTVVFTVVPVVS